MKRLIISEGSHDNLFIRTLLYTKFSKDKSKIGSFDQCTRDTNNILKTSQQRCLSSFYEKTSPYEILVKTEAGKNKIAPVIQSELKYLCENRLNPIIMIDLDNYSSPKKFVEDIENRIKTLLKLTSFKTSITLYKIKNEKASLSLIEISKNGNSFSKIYIISIFKSLEKVISGLDGSGIDKQKELINKFLNKDNDFKLLFKAADI